MALSRLGREWDLVLHHGRQPSNWEPCITRAQAPAVKEPKSPDSWVWSGHGTRRALHVCPQLGREDWGTGQQSPWGARNDNSAFF